MTGSPAGMHLTIVFSNRVEYSQKQEIHSAAKAEWFFIRIPKTAGQFLNHAHFSAPEMTESLFKSERGLVQVLEKNCQVEDQLPEWSKKFPEVKFVFLEADGRGDTMMYSGYLCQAGKKLKVLDPDRLGHIRLLAEVGIRVEKFFPPQDRRYFDDAD